LAALMDDGAIDSDYLAGGEGGDAGAGPRATRRGQTSAPSAAARQTAAVLRGRLELQRACIDLRAGQLSEARAALEALSSWASTAGAADRAHLALLQAGLALRQARLDDARAAAETARSLSNADEDQAAAHLIEGKAAAMPSEARRAFAAGIAAARRAGQLPLLVECLLGMARAHAQSDPATAERYAQLALRAAQARRFTPGAAQAEAVLQELRAAQR
jgi:hypothetical protein